jgi:hypothetical protein
MPKLKPKHETVTLTLRVRVELRDLLRLVADEIPGMSVNALVVSMLESNQARIEELLTISRKLKAAPDPVAAFERVEALVEDARRDAVNWKALHDASDTAVEDQTVKAHG